MHSGHVSLGCPAGVWLMSSLGGSDYAGMHWVVGTNHAQLGGRNSACMHNSMVGAAYMNNWAQRACHLHAPFTIYSGANFIMRKHPKYRGSMQIVAKTHKN